MRALDACTVINLVKSGLFELCINAISGSYFIGQYATDELGPDRDSFMQYVSDGGIGFIDGSDIPSSLFLRILRTYELGDGESEAISIAVHRGYTVCTDDKAARAAAVVELGSDRVIGSLGMLRELVQAGSLPADSAFLAYQRMISGGAFLPTIDIRFFAQC